MNLTSIAALLRLLTPSKNPAGLTSLAAAAYALIQAVAYGHSISDPQVWQPAVVGLLTFIIRQYVTPVADPRDGNGKALVVWSTALSDPERRRAENMRLMHAPEGTQSFYPYPGEPAPPATPPVGDTP